VRRARHPLALNVATVEHRVASSTVVTGGMGTAMSPVGLKGPHVLSSRTVAFLQQLWH